MCRYTRDSRLSRLPFRLNIQIPLHSNYCTRVLSAINIVRLNVGIGTRNQRYQLLLFNRFLRVCHFRTRSLPFNSDELVSANLCNNHLIKCVSIFLAGRPTGYPFIKLRKFERFFFRGSARQLKLS